MNSRIASVVLVLASLVLPGRVSAGDVLLPRVEVEEDVYAYESADNGAGPMWCSGSTCLVRLKDRVFATGLETIKDAKPLNNCRWLLFERAATGWARIGVDESHRTREPSPLACFDDGRFFLSANPTLAPLDAYNGPARPEILEYSARDASTERKTIKPDWVGSSRFTEHSYRSFAADRKRHELFLLQNVGDDYAAWVLLGSDGVTRAAGRLNWPWGADYAKPELIRVCYPNVALANHAVYACGVSDIVEPNPEWRAFKKQLTGREWDYDFRRLFYIWTPDITAHPLTNWLEIASREKTCGWVSPGDLWLAPDGTVHLVWTERAIDERLRAKFFPNARQRHELNYAMVRQGQVVYRRTLLSAEEGQANEIPGLARFQPAPNGRLCVFYYVSGTTAAGKPLSENRLLELKRDGSDGPSAVVPLSHPLNSFFTATPRAGSAPSSTLDLLGVRVDGRLKVSYARVRVY